MCSDRQYIFYYRGKLKFAAVKVPWLYPLVLRVEVGRGDKKRGERESERIRLRYKTAVQNGGKIRKKYRTLIFLGGGGQRAHFARRFPSFDRSSL